MFLLHKVLRVTSRSPACCDPRPWTWCAATFDKKYWSQPWMDIQILKESNKSHSSLSFEVIPPSPLSMNMEKVSANCVSRPGHPGLPGLSPRLTICRDIYSKLDTTMITRVGDCGWWQVATETEWPCVTQFQTSSITVMISLIMNWDSSHDPGLTLQRAAHNSSLLSEASDPMLNISNWSPNELLKIFWNSICSKNKPVQKVTKSTGFWPAWCSFHLLK